MSRKIILFLVLSIIASSCAGGKKVPNLAAIFAQSKTQTGKRPVIIIPGILGSELEDPQTKETSWLSLLTIKGDNLSLPISPNLKANRDTLVVKSIIKKVKISRFFSEVEIYQSLFDAMENYGGYKEGSWETPLADGDRDNYYVFAYDWRLDNVENARLLIQKIEGLKQKLQKPDLRFNIIAHSMGGLIARYAAMYGETDLPENDAKPSPNWSGAKHLNKIFMFGTPNEGSMSVLEGFQKGYKIGRFVIPSLNNEAIFTSPAVFQLLPHQSTARFYDENLKLIEVDLYNPETWKKYKWAVNTNPAFLNKFAGGSQAVDKNGRKSEFADVTLADLDLYFANVLKRARAFQDALDADTTVPASLGFFAFGSDCDPTLDGAVLVKDAKTNEWRTIFAPRSFKNSAGQTVSKTAVRDVLFAPGDFRVTRRSLLAETITQENYRNSIFRRNLPVSATFSCESHYDLPNSKIMQDNFLTALMQELTQ